jgi:hypothetical protein
MTTPPTYNDVEEAAEALISDDGDASAVARAFVLSVIPHDGHEERTATIIGGPLERYARSGASAGRSGRDTDQREVLVNMLGLAGCVDPEQAVSVVESAVQGLPRPR